MQMTTEEVERMATTANDEPSDGNHTKGLFSLNRTFGIMMLPLHRLPERMRKSLLKLDYSMANGWMKEYSSYLVCELIKR